ncbi:MAG: hypothetical protein QXK88_01485 [Desulfurococcaceae archaeon]
MPRRPRREVDYEYSVKALMSKDERKEIVAAILETLAKEPLTTSEVSRRVIAAMGKPVPRWRIYRTLRLLEKYGFVKARKIMFEKQLLWCTTERTESLLSTLRGHRDHTQQPSHRARQQSSQH